MRFTAVLGIISKQKNKLKAFQRFQFWTKTRFAEKQPGKNEDALKADDKYHLKK